MPAATITTICLLLFLGAMGKSAQFPLHVWLPDAMEGPTPVSALIHAATMVTAGVYLVARCTPLFVLAPNAQMVVAAIGATTALIAALIALTQNDLKRVLAYSTVSQLGYMFMALGAGVGGAEAATVAADGRHVPPVHARVFQGAAVPRGRQRDALDGRRDRHAAVRRPAAGAADHALDVSLRRGRRWRACRCCRASGARTKSSRCWQRRRENSPHGTFYGAIQLVAMVTALLTAFYTFRAYFMTFWGEERFPEEAGHHPHEAPPVMAWPLRILAVCALAVGIVFGPTHLFAEYLHHTPGHVARGGARLALGHHDR